MGRRSEAKSPYQRDSGGACLKPRKITSPHDFALALHWEEVRAEYLESNKRTVEAKDARAKAQSFRNQLQENHDG